MRQLYNGGDQRLQHLFYDILISAMLLFHQLKYITEEYLQKIKEIWLVI
jgi:hypothetical protein